MISVLPLLLGLSLCCTQAGGFVSQLESTCILDSDGTPVDFSFCMSFNKDLLTCWDPEQTMMVPRDYGVLSSLASGLSNYLNKMENLIQYLSRGLQDCSSHTQPFWGALTKRIQPPSVQVAETTPFNTREPVMLACYVSGFYPADVTITWRKNGEVVLPQNSAPSVIQPNGDWTYQTVSHLATNPSFGDTYICVVEHAASPDLILQYWTPWLSPLKIVKLTVSAVTLALGLIVFILGFVGWRKSKSPGYTYIPASNYVEDGRIS
ncbi:HLA class II histocompatibility antigen, DM beta chain [Sorex araneus]|uniref:HLA class II histocompatibility antigen, DM beta chain n=1 Tax=Sorex araneus TaxID=42254 RepID=UPI0001581D92|nr:HLA class II histocompatibility antigen, DM beta chain [Sorex araneus]